MLPDTDIAGASGAADSRLGRRRLMFG
jgi:hypothetical protein